MIYPWLEPHCTALAGQLEAGRLGHAPLVHGPSGVGKLALVEWLASRILCLSPNNWQACGHCRSCELISTGTHPDLFCVDIDTEEEKRSISVDQIRELIEKMQLTPSVGRNRVGLIVSADAMNRNAANALLKTLEEPAAGSWLILRSHRPARLPATIRSRCQQIALRPPQPEVARQWLAEQDPNVTDERRETALVLAGGAPLAALQMLDSGELERGLDILDSLVGKHNRPASALVEQWQDEAEATWQWLARWSALLMRQAGGVDTAMPGVPVSSVRLDAARLARLWEQALEGYRLAERGSVRQELLLGKWLLEWEALIEAGN